MAVRYPGVGIIIAATVMTISILARAMPSEVGAQGSCSPNPSPPDAADPSIRVASPAAGARVGSPLTITGLARVFEATVSFALFDAAGRPIARGFTTAAAAGPALAPFTGTLPFSVAQETAACLWVFEESARDGSPRNVVQVPLTLQVRGRYVESALNLADPRPCIPEAGEQTCTTARAALWNGDEAAWRARGVADPDARFNETVVFRVRAGDPATVAAIARILGAPYLQVTRLLFAGSLPGQTDEFIEIANLGGGAQDMTGWSVRSPARNLRLPFTPGFVMRPGQSCRIFTGILRGNVCGEMQFRATDVWPDGGGVAVLFYDALALPGAETRYSADPENQPPPPNLQGSSGLVTP